MAKTAVIGVKIIEIKNSHSTPSLFILPYASERYNDRMYQKINIAIMIISAIKNLFLQHSENEMIIPVFDQNP